MEHVLLRNHPSDQPSSNIPEEGRKRRKEAVAVSSISGNCIPPSHSYGLMGGLTAESMVKGAILLPLRNKDTRPRLLNCGWLMSAWRYFTSAVLTGIIALV